MIAQVLKELPVLLKSAFEPGKIDRVDVLIGYLIPGFRHRQRVSVGDDSFQGLALDASVAVTFDPPSVGDVPTLQRHLFRRLTR
jgi:hypothetical protein